MLHDNDDIICSKCPDIRLCVLIVLMMLASVKQCLATVGSASQLQILYNRCRNQGSYAAFKSTFEINCFLTMITAVT